MILAAISIVLLACIALPYLQGSFSRTVIIVSTVLQLLGFVGLVFVPVGVVGLAVNKLNVSQSQNNPLNFGLSMITLVLGALLYATMNLYLILNGDYKASVLTLLLGVFVSFKVTGTLRHKRGTIRFKRLFVYLIVIPLVAFFGRKVLAPELAENSRNETITQAAMWIKEIEQYKNTTGDYPDSLMEIETRLPQPEFMGIDDFTYEKRNGIYNLSFVQWVDMGAVKEVVVYSNSDTYNMKGHFASYTANEPHWKYFWLD